MQRLKQNNSGANLQLNERELQPHVSSFWHCRLRLTREMLREIRELLSAAALDLAEFNVTDDPNGIYRCIDFAGASGVVKLRMEDVNAAPRFHVPSFEAAWAAIMRVFPASTSF
jgi:hypothetical protein